MEKTYGQVTFGVAKELITPRERTTLIGFGSVFGIPFTDIHDDIYVRTLLLEDADGEKVLLIGFDLLFHDDTLPNALRAYASEKYGVKPECLHVSYSHTHYGPAVKGYDFNYATDSYEAFLLDRVCASIDRAFLNTRKGTMQFAAVEGDWNISRRLPQNGVMDFAPNPVGEADKNLYLLKLCDEQGKMRALLTSFACHPSNCAGYNTMSSEYPGRLCSCIEGEYYGCTALFFQGFGSDAKLKKGMKTNRFAGLSYEELDDVARSMLLGIKNKMISNQWQDVPVKLGGKLFVAVLPLEINSYAYYEQTRDHQCTQAIGKPGVKFVREPGKIEDSGRNGPKLMWSCADFVLDNYVNLPETLSLNCGVVQLNPDFYIFSMGGEPGVNIQTVLREAFPDKQILCFGYNDAIAYVPSDKMIAEGGYEAGDRSDVEYRLKGKCKPGVDEIYIAGYRKAMEEIKNSNG